MELFFLFFLSLDLDIFLSTFQTEVGEEVSSTNWTESVDVMFLIDFLGDWCICSNINYFWLPPILSFLDAGESLFSLDNGDWLEVLLLIDDD